MKKLSLILITVLLLGFFSVGCSSNKNEKAEEQKSIATQSEEENKEKVNNSTLEKEQKEDIKEEPKEEVKEEAKEEVKSNVIEEKSSVKDESSVSKNSSNKNNETPNNEEEKSNDDVSNEGEYVYANGGKSKSNKYHSSPNAHKMEGSIKMTKQQAESQGYVACKKCY